MNWTPEALELVRSLKTNCVDFIYGAAEHLAKLLCHEKVQIEDVQTVWSWMDSARQKP